MIPFRRLIQNPPQTALPALLVMFVMFTITLSISVFAATPLSDVSISDAVEDELILDKAVPDHLIDIETRDGIVTLSGVVDNLLAKERATRITETVKGVRSVVNMINVVPSILRSDSEIKDDILDSLLMDSATEAYELDVEVKDNVVTLSGTVDSWKERELAAKVAKGVRGVTGLENNIAVNFKMSRPDVEIKADIEKALQWHTLVDNVLIRVNVDDGRVDLSGTVGSGAEKRQAIALAYVAGVREVNADDLKVARWMRDDDLRENKYIARTDEEIRDAVKDALLYDPRVKSFNVTPEVDGATVTLRGTVDNLKAKRSAFTDARNTVGVVYVQNRLKVRPEKPVTDNAIEKRILKTLDRDPYLDHFDDFAVTAVNGLVDLYGSVDTRFEKERAGDLAARVNGVIAVENNILVRNYDPFPYNPYTDEWRSYRYDTDTAPSANRSYALNDADIKEEIKDEMFWSPFVDADQVKVDVNEGVAILEGKVDSWMEYDAAAENAYEGGAVAIVNNLEVESP